MMAQHTNARTADRGCCRPCRPRGSGTAARKERMLPAGWASMRCLHAENPRCGRLPYRQDLSYPPQAQSVKSPVRLPTGPCQIEPEADRKGLVGMEAVHNEDF